MGFPISKVSILAKSIFRARICRVDTSVSHYEIWKYCSSTTKVQA